MALEPDDSCCTEALYSLARLSNSKYVCLPEIFMLSFIESSLMINHISDHKLKILNSANGTRKKNNPQYNLHDPSFGFPFCQHLWDLTKRWDDIAVADMVVDKKMVDMELDIVADMAADKKMADMELDMVANMQIGKVADMFKTSSV